MTSMGGGGALLMPVQGWKSSDFGTRYDPYYRVWQLHAGTDFAAGGGTPIHAAAGGRIVHAARPRGGGAAGSCRAAGTAGTATTPASATAGERAGASPPATATSPRFSCTSAS